MLRTVEKKFIYIFYFDAFVFSKKIWFYVKTGDFQCLYAKAGSPGAGSDFWLYFNNFYFLAHKTSDLQLKKDGL